MKTKSFHHGKWTYKTYLKPVGHGFECGLIYKGKALFTGNFLKSKEANEWYRHMNSEITTFAKRYWATEDTSITFYTKFLGNHLFSKYYKFINKLVPRYNKEFEKVVNKDVRKYKKLKQDWYPQEKLPIKGKAA